MDMKDYWDRIYAKGSKTGSGTSQDFTCPSRGSGRTTGGPRYAVVCSTGSGMKPGSTIPFRGQKGLLEVLGTQQAPQQVQV